MQDSHMGIKIVSSWLYDEKKEETRELELLQAHTQTLEKNTHKNGG